MMCVSVQLTRGCVFVAARADVVLLLFPGRMTVMMGCGFTCVSRETSVCEVQTCECCKEIKH